MTAVHFSVRGVPKPQGSMRAFVRGGRPIVTSTTRGLREWRDAMAWQARASMDGKGILVGPVEGSITFTLARPKSHYRADGSVRPSAPAHPSGRPDIDKLLRASLDAMTGVVYLDDAQIFNVQVAKAYTDWAGDEPGVDVFLKEEAT